MDYDFEINTNQWNSEELDIIETHLRNYNEYYEYVDDTIIVHCRSESEYDDLDNLIYKLRRR